MPIYEYKCDNCDHQLELLQKFNDEPLKTCPSCGKESVRKLVSAAAFHLKGTGWYVTDFKDKPKGQKDSQKAVNNTKKSDADKNSESTSKESKTSDNNSTDKKSTDSSPKTATKEPD